ncbi:hypothetical protein EMCRGX_G022136 [Ephydatia muelleri]
MTAGILAARIRTAEPLCHLKSPRPSAAPHAPPAATGGDVTAVSLLAPAGHSWPTSSSRTSTSASWVTSQPWYINTCFNNTCRGGQLASSMLRRSSEENVAPASNEKTRVPAGPRSVLNNNGELEGDRPHEKPEPLLVEVEIEGPRQAAEPHPVGSGGNLVTGCTHQAKSGTKVALACLGCDQTCHYHDVVMLSGRPSPLTDLGPRVEARRVPPKCNPQMDWLGVVPGAALSNDGNQSSNCTSCESPLEASVSGAFPIHLLPAACEDNDSVGDAVRWRLKNSLTHRGLCDADGVARGGT